MSNEIVHVQPDYESMWKLSQRVSNTVFVPSALRGKNEAVLACVLYGAELGLGPMQALNSIHVIEGRTAMSPELMRAMVARHGHRIDVLENSNTACELEGTRADTGSTAKVRWTMEDAKMAGLAGKNNWKTYPRAMLLARATSELCRIVFPDVIAGLSYTPEEVATIEGVDYVNFDLKPGVMVESTVLDELSEGMTAAADVLEKALDDLDAEVVEGEIVEEPALPIAGRNYKYIGKTQTHSKADMPTIKDSVEDLLQSPPMPNETSPAFDKRLAIAESWGKWPYVKAITSVCAKKIKRDMPISFYELAHDELLFEEVQKAIADKSK